MPNIFNLFFFPSPERPLKTTESNVRSSRSVSTGTQAFSGKSGTVSANSRDPCESAKCSSETDRGSANPHKMASKGSANPHKMASKGSANPHKMASKGSAAPSKSAPKGSAGCLKTAASNDDSSSSRRSPTKVRLEGVLVDVEGFSHPSRSAPSSRPQVPPNLTVWFSFEKKEKIYQETILRILLICVCHFICLSAVAPSGRCFKTCAIGVVSKFKLKESCCFWCFCLHAFCFGWIEYHRISTTPSEISFSLSCKSVRLLCILSSAVLRVPSPANKSHCTGGVRHIGRSLTKMENKRGPRIDT